MHKVGQEHPFDATTWSDLQPTCIYSQLSYGSRESTVVAWRRKFGEDTLTCTVLFAASEPRSLHPHQRTNTQSVRLYMRWYTQSSQTQRRILPIIPLWIQRHRWSFCDLNPASDVCIMLCGVESPKTHPKAHDARHVQCWNICCSTLLQRLHTIQANCSLVTTVLLSNRL